MANTTNFNWETPDDTDLVKDGAAAIRTLGSAIDTSLVDLKGGTTDQVLAKNSNTDMDFKWVTSDDANAIQNAIIDAKGDLIVGTAADTPARLAVGTNGHVLTADSAETSGVKWAAASSTPSFVGVKMSRQATQSISNSTWTAVSFDVESFDTDSFWTLSPNPTRFTVPSGKAGKYLLTGAVDYAANQTGIRAATFRINGTEKFYLNWASAATGDRAVLVGSTIFDLAVGDYVELFTIQTSGTSVNISNNLGGNDGSSNFSAQYLGA
jgi:hypothetical protein